MFRFFTAYFWLFYVGHLAFLALFVAFGLFCFSNLATLRHQVEKSAKFCTWKHKVQEDRASKYTAAVISQRDSFILMMVVISERTMFHLQYVLNYPITDVPLSIAQSDGSRVTTAKSVLLHKPKALQEGVHILSHIDVTVIDGELLKHFYLSAIGSISSYGKLARQLLGNVCRFVGQEGHVLFDKYLTTSLKESER